MDPPRPRIQLGSVRAVADPPRAQRSVKHTVRQAAVRTGTYAVGKAALDAVWRERQRRAGTFSQFGEDRDVMRRLGPIGTYLDIGANHPYKGNNTYLLYRTGWRGMAIEPIRSHVSQHRRIRPRDVCVVAAAGRQTGRRRFHELNPSGFSTFDDDAAATLVATRRAVLIDSYEVDVVTATDAWCRHFPGQTVDFVAIDTEGHELEVLAGLDVDLLRPRLVLVEFERPTAPSHADAIVATMQAVGYELVDSFGVNGLFAPS
jgi:FkbM family methyltransferase